MILNIKWKQGVYYITCFNMKGRKYIHIVRWQNAKQFIGEVGSHEPSHGPDNPHCSLRMNISSHSKLTGRLLRS